MYLLTSLPVAVGILSHVVWFNRGEHHMWATTYAASFFAGLVGGIAALVRFGNLSVSTSVFVASTVAASYLFGVFSSLLIYRLYLSPLSKFPGPWQAKVSELWYFYKMTHKDSYYQHEALHRKYGRYVRVGSNVLSITDVDMHEAAFGPRSKIRKSPWYDASAPLSSLHTTRERGVHDARRRVWAPAFSDKALREYEPKMREFSNRLVQQIRDRQGEAMDMSKWFSLFAFDVMGQLAFGRSYGMLESGERHWALDLLEQGMSTAKPRTPIWLFRLLTKIPFAASGYHKFVEFSRQQLEWRIENKNPDADITGWILKAYAGVEKPANDLALQADSRLIIIAGSDTTATTLTYLFYELAKKPEEVHKVRQELQKLAVGEWSHTNIMNAEHLNGAINESLRLHPPVPSGLERTTPKEGVQVGEVYLPGGVNFWMPQYVIGRDEEYYENALEFIPERWYSRPNMIKHKAAFAPFSLGVEGCIGKNLAYVEMRTLVAQILLELDVAFAPGEDCHRLLYDSKDHFTMSLGAMDLIFTPTEPEIF